MFSFGHAHQHGNHHDHTDIIIFKFLLLFCLVHKYFFNVSKKKAVKVLKIFLRNDDEKINFILFSYLLSVHVGIKK